jgi:hypothetical protein
MNNKGYIRNNQIMMANPNPRSILLQANDVLGLSKVKSFLDSIERNSTSSRNAYSTGLRHFHNFITQKYPKFNAETILTALSNKINVYELLDSFVSNTLEIKKGITPKSVSFYITAIRSLSCIL